MRSILKAKVCFIKVDLLVILIVLRSKMQKQNLVMILVFYMVVPTLDQVTDIRMVARLLHGPEAEFQINSGEFT